MLQLFYSLLSTYNIKTALKNLQFATKLTELILTLILIIRLILILKLILIILYAIYFMPDISSVYYNYNYRSCKVGLIL